ncbi:F0F1 ATP synthase subunit epsilon [bacterium]|nr:F0F1 ATP synthase subunit epsilon [bacterium]MCI0565584.1 F0F1 ATP synthase subunit epsilon [bacterium]
MLNLTITTIDKILYKGGAKSVTVPAREGVMTVLPHHIPLITPLDSGIILVKPEGEGVAQAFEIKKGFLEVGKEETTILV